MNFNERIAAILLGKKPVGFETINVNSGAVAVLTPPVVTDPKDRAYIAVMCVEADASESGLSKVLRFREDGTAPTTAVGMIMGDAWIYEVQGYDQIANFKMRGTNASALIITKVSVTYYKLGDQ